MQTLLLQHCTIKKAEYKTDIAIFSKHLFTNNEKFRKLRIREENHTR